MNDHHDNILIMKKMLMIITGHLGPRPNPAIFRSTGSHRPALLGEEKSTATMRMIRVCITIRVDLFLLMMRYSKSIVLHHYIEAN